MFRPHSLARSTARSFFTRSPQAIPASAKPSTASSPLPRFVLYSGGQECALCDEAIDLLDDIDAVDFELDVVNIRGSPDTPELRRLRRRYQYSIPVLTLEGKEIMHGKIQESAVIKAVEQWRAVHHSERQQT